LAAKHSLAKPDAAFKESPLDEARKEGSAGNSSDIELAMQGVTP
jgi:hypothetical protein